jgi:hypothetical protein
MPFVFKLAPRLISSSTLIAARLQPSAYLLCF